MRKPPPQRPGGVTLSVKHSLGPLALPSLRLWLKALSLSVWFQMRSRWAPFRSSRQSGCSIGHLDFRETSPPVSLQRGYSLLLYFLARDIHILCRRRSSMTRVHVEPLSISPRSSTLSHVCCQFSVARFSLPHSHTHVTALRAAFDPLRHS